MPTNPPQNPPQGWPQISSSLFYEDPSAALDWLTKAFGFEIRVKIEGPDGSLAHCELEYGGGLIMLGQASAQGSGSPGSERWRSPRMLDGANTQSLYVYVDDIDAHFERARAAGATILQAPETRHYGDRVYSAQDPEGHHWWFGQRVDDEAWKAATQEGQ